MAGSLKTANYKLSKYAPNDITSWLVDFNGNMDKIDGQMKKNADANVGTTGKVSALTQRVTAAEGKIENNSNQIDTIKNNIEVSPIVMNMSSNLTHLNSELISILNGLIIGSGNYAINKTGDQISTIDISDENRKFVPISTIAENPFGLETISSPTISNLETIGSLYYKTETASESNVGASDLYAYYNGTNTIAGYIAQNATLVQATTFFDGIMTILKA